MTNPVLCGTIRHTEKTKEIDTTEIENIEKAMKVYFAAGGKITKCPTRKAPGSVANKTILARSKKCMFHDTTSAPKMRLMNFDSAFNIPVTYDGCKMVMGNY